MSKRPSGILICVPAYGSVMQARTAETIYAVGQFLTRCGINNQLSWFSAADIAEVRNLFLTMWYDHHKHMSHMLFIDSDMGFSPELIRDFIKFDKPLMGVLYARREMVPSIVGTAPLGHSLKDIQDNHGFLPATAIGGGVMMISRKMIDEMLRQKPELSQPTPEYLRKAMAALDPAGLPRILRMFEVLQTPEAGRLSEDISFCHRVREAGFEVWANCRHLIHHIGPFDFKLRYEGVMEQKEKAAADAEVQQVSA